MTKFWPYAVVDEGKKKKRLQYSYQPCRSTEACIETIALWDEHYHMNIVDSYIDIEENGKVVKRIPVTKEWKAHIDKEILNPLSYTN